MKNRPEIDGLRCIAVLAVIMFHLDERILPGGFVGVDIFFVISGYLITGKIQGEIEGNRFSLKEFYLRRFLRLYPTLLTAVTATFLFSMILFTDLDLKNLAFSVVQSLLSFSNIGFWKQSGYFDVEASRKPLLHTWSLAVEEQFYLIWPIISISMLSFFRGSCRAVFLCILSILSVSLICCEVILRKDGSAAFYLTPFRIYEFMCGSILLWSPKSRSLQVRSIASLLLFAATIYTLFSYHSGMNFPGTLALVPCITTAGLLHLSEGTKLANVLSFFPLVFIGKISYSLYLVHWPIIVLYKYASGYEILQPGDFALLLLFMFPIALAFYRKVETQFYHQRRFGSQVSRTQSGLSLKDTSLLWKEKPKTLCSASIVILAFTLHCWASGGWQHRKELFRNSIPIDRNKTTELGVSISEFENTVRRFQKSRRTRKYDDNGPIIGSQSPSALKAVFLGDSLSQHFLPLAHYYGHKYNVLFHIWWYSACSGLKNTYSVFNPVDFGPSFKERERICEEKRAKWIHDFEKGNFSVLFLASRWMKMMEPQEYGSFRQGAAQFFLINASENPTESQLSIAKSRQTMAVALTETITLARSIGTRVVVVSQPPDTGRNPSGCLSRPSLFSEYTHDTKGQPFWCVGATREQSLKQLKFTNDILLKATEQNSDVFGLFPSSYLCQNWDQDETYCRVIWYDKVLYKDQHHFTDFGAIYIALKWEPTFRQVISRQRISQRKISRENEPETWRNHAQRS